MLFRARRRLRTLLTGANLAAAPLVLREDLARLIPGFDPTTAGLAGRLAALPPTFKLASAAVGVGLVATGAAELPDPIAATDRSRGSVTRVVPTPEPRLHLVASPPRHVASVAPHQTAGGNDAGSKGKSVLPGLHRRGDSEDREPEVAETRERDELEEDEVEREELPHDIERADEPEPEDQSEPEGADGD